MVFTQMNFANIGMNFKKIQAKVECPYRRRHSPHQGKSDQLIAQLQERYHFDRERAETEFHSFIESLDTTMREKVGTHGKERKK